MVQRGGAAAMPGTVVVVDQEKEFVSELGDILTEAGYSVFGWIGRDEAVQGFQTIGRSVDVAIIDFVVPGASGPELIGAVKSHFPTIRVIATVPGEGPDLSALVARTDADRVMRRPKKGIPFDRLHWTRAVDEMIEGRIQQP